MALSICVAVSANWPEYGMIRPILTVPCWAPAGDTTAISAAALATTIDLRMKSSRDRTAQPAILAPTVVAAAYRVNLAAGLNGSPLTAAIGGPPAVSGRPANQPSGHRS